MESYSILVQASPEEILHASYPEDLNLSQLRQWPSINRLLVMLPEVEGVEVAVARLHKWGFQSFVGDPFNAYRRAVAAQKSLGDQSFAVRVLAIWKHLDLAYVIAWRRRCARTRAMPCWLPRISNLPLLRNRFLTSVGKNRRFERGLSSESKSKI